jgi:Uma2 family endonuclease
VENVVQPDISVFCDRSKIDERGAKGAPNLIVEILSPSTMKIDFGIKLLLYQQYGVKEYWIADPDAKTVNVYKLDLIGKYFLDKIYQAADTLKVGIFPDLEISLTEIFEE